MRFAILIALLTVVAGGCSTGADVTDRPDFTQGPEPTEEPFVEDPTPAPVTFETITIKGKGNKVAKFKIPEEAVGIATITHSGSRNFIVSTVDASGDETDLLVNEIGKYKGTVLFDESAGAHSVAFKIEASGSWTVVIKPLLSATNWDGVDTLKGSGDAVRELVPPSDGFVTLAMTYKGDGNFIVSAYSPDGIELLVNEIDSFKGEVLLPDGTFLLEVSADGPWSANPG